MKAVGFYSIIPDSGAAAIDPGSRIKDSQWMLKQVQHDGCTA